MRLRTIVAMGATGCGVSTVHGNWDDIRERMPFRAQWERAVSRHQAVDHLLEETVIKRLKDDTAYRSAFAQQFYDAWKTVDREASRRCDRFDEKKDSQKLILCHQTRKDSVTRHVNALQQLPVEAQDTPIEHGWGHMKLNERFQEDLKRIEHYHKSAIDYHSSLRVKQAAERDVKVLLK